MKQHPLKYRKKLTELAGFKNQSRKKWVNCRVVFIDNIVRKGGDGVMTRVSSVEQNGIRVR